MRHTMTLVQEADISERDTKVWVVFLLQSSRLGQPLSEILLWWLSKVKKCKQENKMKHEIKIQMQIYLGQNGKQT